MFKKSFLGLLMLVVSLSINSELPVKIPSALDWQEIPYQGITNFLTVDAIHSCIKSGNERGLILDFSGISRLLDGTILDNAASISGKVYLGPYPFEAAETTYSYKRFKMEIPLEKGNAILPVGHFLETRKNSENWVNQGLLVMRLDLYLTAGNNIRPLGLYDTFILFKKESAPGGDIQFVKQPTIIEGPLVNLSMSDDPSQLVISFKTDQPVMASVVLNNGRTFTAAQTGRGHEITVTGLEAARDYDYCVQYEGFKSKPFTFHTAPAAGEGDVIIAYAGDSRNGTEGGTAKLMGVNSLVLERCVNLAFMLGADVFTFGGDLVNANTSSIDDFRTQMNAWKQTMAGFWNHRPVYASPGNHESLLKVYINPKTNQTLVLDRWPYETDSSEAVFAGEMVNPNNGPETGDPRRPTYKENVYSFQYGPVKYISFNNTYWVSREYGKPIIPGQTGGCPEGYLLEDQLQWIQKELDAGEKNPTVKYIILSAHEPVFPNGGHIRDGMWYNGNNNIKAYTYNAGTGTITAEKAGIIEVRNRLVKMVSQNKKVAAVLGGDEHAYHKILIDKHVPIGVPGSGADGSNPVCPEGGFCAPFKDIKYPTWYLVSGDAGAPYYSEEQTPWNMYWKQYPGIYPNHTSMRGCFHYSSQENLFIFKANREKISLTVYNPYGEIIDSIADLLKVKENRK